jgi:dipeptidyl-peptidase-4
MNKTIAFVLLSAVPCAAQTPRQFAAEDYARAERFLGANTFPLVSGMGVQPNWLPDGRFWYRATTPAGFSFVTVDPVRRTKASSFDQSRLATALAAATGARVEADRLPFGTFQLSRDGREITVATQPNRRWKCDLQTYACTAVDTVRAAGAPMPAPPNSSVSPDGLRAVYVRDHNLWVKDLVSGAERQLTSDGIKDFAYATNNAGWIRSPRPAVTWSPDSKKVATFQHDGRGVSEMYLVTTNVGAPRLDAWKYPLPGDSVIFRVQRVVIDVESGRAVRLQMPADQHRSTISDHIVCGARICDLLWYPDAAQLAFVSVSRDHKHVVLRVADASTGAVRTLHEETAPTQFGDVGLNENWRVLPGSNELIWWSDRENWVHLYLHDLATGRLKNRITSGNGNVNDILRVDERARVIYYEGQGKETGRDPYFRHLYRIGFDGKGNTLLTPENADHQVSISPDGKYFIDVYSTQTTPPVTVLRDTKDGRVLLELERADISRLVATGWKPPTPVTVKARDGRTDIYGLMFTPTRVDSSAKYPVVNYVYPAPSGSVGSRSFSPAWGDHQSLAELGFVVILLDGMGTAGRSKEFADVTYGKMADNTIPDQIAGIKELAQRHRFIDVDRVGIWGHSGGGFATATAMFKFPDFYKVGVSRSGNHDNRNYEDDWGERYEGLLERRGNTDNYADEANQVHARNLKGKLLLAHGGMDDNVPPYNTNLVVEALIKANKEFDLIMFPNAGHGYGADNNYMMLRQWNYFVKHLLGAEPPKDYQIGRRLVQ